jgi:hypothetical protein
LLFSRLALVATGFMSMVLGYKLLCRGIGLPKTSGQGSTIESSIAGAKISVKNAAPGTAFALFGAILLVVMLIQSSPSVTLETISKWKTGSDAQLGAENTQTAKLTLRSNDQNSILALTLAGKEYERRGDTANAERSYRDAVTQIAEPINDLAWLYLQSGRAKDAVGLAKLAVQIKPDEPRYADTFSKASASGH